MNTLDLHFNSGDALAASQLNQMVDGINESLAELPKMAKKDGYYESLGAGYAKSMLGTGASVPAELTRRTAGGTADIASGVASFKAIKGNTIVWNQLVNTPVKTVSSSNVLARYIGIVGHKYLVKSMVSRASVSHSTDYQIYLRITNGSSLRFGVEGTTFITELPSNSIEIALIFYSTSEGAVTSTLTVFDLTQMFGVGNEPASVAEFEALFPDSYYPYNAGQLLSLTAQNFVTDGFNQWDEEWENGYWNTVTGEYVSSSQWKCSKNAIACFPNTTYRNTKDSQNFIVLFYDENGGYLHSYLDVGGNTTFTTPAGARQMRFYCSEETTYCCVNLSWSGVRNGEYEPYWKSEKTLDLTTIKGKLNGQGESVTIFPDGMRSAGSVHDELVRDASGNIVQAVVKLGKRTYTSGDESDATLVTDKTNTIYPLTTPQTYVLDEPIDPNYRVDDFGTESIEPLTDAQGNPATAPFKAEIVYGPNVQDTIRRLPSNYLSIADYKTGISNLASALGTLLDKTIAIAWSGDNGSVPTFTITDNPTE